MTDLNKEIQYVKGVGPARAKSLNKLGIYTLGDLITYYPRDYEDRSIIKKIDEIKDGEKCTIEASAVTTVNLRMLGRTRSIEKVIVRDDTDSCMLTWFNQP